MNRNELEDYVQYYEWFFGNRVISSRRKVKHLQRIAQKYHEYDLSHILPRLTPTQRDRLLCSMPVSLDHVTKYAEFLTTRSYLKALDKLLYRHKNEVYYDKPFYDELIKQLRMSVERRLDVFEREVLRSNEASENVRFLLS